MMKALILGITGFAGPFLAHNLISHGFRVSGTDFQGTPLSDPELKDVPVTPCDITDEKQVRDVISRTLPDRVFMLAGFTSPRLSVRMPQACIRINAIGTVNVIQACAAHIPGSRILLVSTGNFYRHGENVTVTEDSEPVLTNPYAISKFAGEQYARMEAGNSGLQVVIARPFNHTGPGQEPVFAVPSFAAQILETQKNCPDNAVIRTGNTDTYRDFSDVRDTVNAYRQCAEKGAAGEVYNIASGRAVRIRDMLDDMLAAAGLSARVETDPERCMPEPRGSFSVDLSKIRNATGWSPQIALSDTIDDIFTWLKTGKRRLSR